MRIGPPESPKHELAFGAVASSLIRFGRFAGTSSPLFGSSGWKSAAVGEPSVREVPVRWMRPPAPVVGVGAVLAPQPEMVTWRLAASDVRESGSGSNGSLRSR